MASGVSPRSFGSDSTARRSRAIHVSASSPQLLSGLQSLARTERYPRKNGPFASHAQVPALVGDGPGTLLDVGCAQGDLLVQVADRGWSAVGVEPDPGDAA